MKEEALNIQPEDIFSSGYNSSEEQEENNFNSPEAFPENIFANQYKENSEQLSSKILAFPFTLDSYELINLNSKDELLSYGNELLIIFGNMEKLKNNELILKLIFISKDKNISLNLKEYQNEIKSLIYLDLEFIAIFKNKLFIKYENENLTNEAYVSLQKSSAIFDLLYDEENSLNLNEDNSEKKNNNKISEDKKEENKNICGVTNKNITNENKNLLVNNKISNFVENTNSNINNKKNIFPQNYPKIQNNKMIKEQQMRQIPINPIILSPQLYSPFIFPINNFQKFPQINPQLMTQMPKTNPYFINTAIAMQNFIKFQQTIIKNNNIINNNVINNDRKELLNNIKNINQINNNMNNNNINNNNIKININSNINKNNNLSPQSNKESSTNSNTSSSSSNVSSPNYQPKNTKNFKIENNNNINNINNNIINNNNINNNINNIYINNNLSKNINYNLEEIVQNKQYKEYVPKNIKEKEKELIFQTNSTRDYQYKYVSRYIVQIENEKNFPVTKMIIGNNGMLLRNILYDNCIKYGDHTTKIRLRGKGSGYKEGPKNEESKDPMELCISSLNMISFTKCSNAIENLLLQIYYRYYSYQCKNFMEKNNNNTMVSNPITMKKILRYRYVVNRYNTLVKEEKRRKKEEELNKGNKNSEKECDIDN